MERVKKTAEKHGRDPNDIEFQSLSLWTEITDNPKPIIERIAKRFNSKAEDIEKCWHVMVGSSSEIKDKIKILHEIGFNYFVFYLRSEQFEDYAKSIVKPLTK